MAIVPRLALVIALSGAASASPQFFFSGGSVHDEPLDGAGDTLNLNPELIARDATSEDRAMREFYAGQFVGQPISNATISGTIVASDLTDVGPRTIDFYVYAADGNVSEGDFEASGLLVGSVTYHPPNDTFVGYLLDATTQVATLFGQGAAFVGIRAEASGNASSPANLLDDSTAQFTITGFFFEGPFCFGDGGFGPFCTPCPCGNTAPPTAISGGCLNGSGLFGILHRNGVASVMNDSLGFTANGCNPNTFAILVSGDDRLPANPANPCFGLDTGVQSVALDGLRCVGANLLRHGARATDDFGTPTSPWGQGGAPAGGIVAQGAFASGTQRHFQCFYREDAALVCQTGQNTTNAVTVTILP